MAESILQEADRLVDGDRQGEYGHPYDDFSKTAAFWSVLFGVHVEPWQVGYAMMMVKLSREMHKFKRDNRVDMAGYIKTVQMILKKVGESS